jgi:hypothetical protein
MKPVTRISQTLFDGNEIVVTFPLDREATAILIVHPEPSAANQLQLIPLPGQCWDVLGTDEDCQAYELIKVSFDCPRCGGPIVKLLAATPFSAPCRPLPVCVGDVVS